MTNDRDRGAGGGDETEGSRAPGRRGSADPRSPDVSTPAADHRGVVLAALRPDSAADAGSRSPDPLLEASPDGVHVMSGGSEPDTFNDRFVELWGLPEERLASGDAERVLGMLTDRVVDADAFLQHVVSGLEHPDGTRGRRVRLTDGTVLDQRSGPLRGADGGHRGVVWFYRDITEEYRTESALRASVDALHDLTDALSDTGTSLDAKRRSLLELGTDYLDLPYGFVTERSGTTSTVVAATGTHDPPRSTAVAPGTTSHRRRTTESERGVLAVRDATRDDRASDMAAGLETYIRATLSVDGTAHGTVWFGAAEPRRTAFTQVERAYVERLARGLSAALERHERDAELDARNEQLAEWVGVISHDLRNPLSVAAGHLEMALSESDSEHLRAVERAHDRMRTLVDDVLQLSQDGDIIGDQSRVDLAAVGEACWEHTATADARVEVHAERSIVADRSRLRQLLENLLRNAVEHGGSGVTVTVGDLPDGFYVEDTGVGIPEADRTQLLDPACSPEHGGAGLGLRIVERIATAHGWETTVTAGTDGGARFEITGVERP